MKAPILTSLLAATILFAGCRKCAECERDGFCVKYSFYNTEENQMAFGIHCFENKDQRLELIDSLSIVHSGVEDSLSYSVTNNLDNHIEQCDHVKNEIYLDSWISFHESREYQCSKK